MVRTGVCFFLGLLSIMFWSPQLQAQQVTPEALQKLQELQGQQDVAPTVDVSPVDTARKAKFETPSGQLRPETPSVSRLEQDYSDRTGAELRLFGYDVFATEVSPAQLGTGRIPDDYVLGIGDELIFTFHGSTKRTIITRVDREGRVILPDLRPIPAIGRIYGDFRREVEARTATALLGTEVFVSLGSVRMVSVFVVGEVKRPGLHRVTSLTTVIESLALAGGVKKSGSLRGIIVKRGGKNFDFDLYDVFRGGDSGGMKLQDGDSIIVPMIGATVAVEGEVHRPAIYELAKNQSVADIDTLLDLAGGTMRPKGNSIARTTFTESGRQSILDVADRSDEVVDGDIITVQRKENIQIGFVSLNGHVRVSGQRPLASTPSVARLIHDVNNLQINPYLPFAVVETTDKHTQSRIFQPINLEHVLRGESDYPLTDRDNVIVLSAADVEFLSTRLVRSVILTGKASQNMCPSLRRLARFVSDANLDRYATAIRSFVIVAEEQFEEAQPCPAVFDENIDLLPFVLEYVIGVNGAVRKPGVFPVTTETTLASLLAVTGGASNNADWTFVELLEYLQRPDRGEASIDRKILDLTTTIPESITVSPGSAIRFNALVNDQERAPVQLVGEFLRPGTYTIRRGETLAELIERAGGLTEQAFPYGAVFTRQSVRASQQSGFRRTAREINTGLAAAALRGDVDGQALEVAQNIANQLNQIEALGRVVIEADPAVLRARPALEVILEPGDRLMMPKRPNFVSVVGEVLNPASLQFFAGKSADQYIAEAGGPLETAERKRIFVVYPNGEAKPIRSRFWQFSSLSIPPGSTIVVPKDVTPLNVLRVARDVSAIMSQLAISAASIAVIGR